MKPIILAIAMVALPFLTFSQNLDFLYSNNLCGLNYAYDLATTSSRFTPAPGNGTSTNLTISGIPNCVVIDKAFLWWSGIGNANNPNCTFDGTPVVGVRIGSIGGPQPVESYRADVTALMTSDGNGTYPFIQTIGNDMDGVALMVIYRDYNATYKGAFRLVDGLLRHNVGDPPLEYENVNAPVCERNDITLTPSVAFSLLGGLQDQNPPGGHIDTVTSNSVYSSSPGVGAFANNFYNWDEIPMYFYGISSTAKYKIVTPNDEAYSLIMAGVYHQTTTCSDCNMPLDELSIPNTPTNPLCNGDNNGQILATPQGGLAPYNYEWNTVAPQTTATATGLIAGTYTVTVTDATGCSLDSTFTLTEPDGFTYTTDSTNSNCGVPDGTASVINFAGGAGPNYTYSWNTSSQTTAVATGLAPGVHTATVTDANSCSTTIDITVEDNPAFTASVTSTDALCYGTASGIATAAGADPAVTYTYEWNTSPPQTTETATGLSAGNYIVKVTDAFGCFDTALVIIGEPTTSITLNAGNDITICYGDSTIISATATGGTGTYNYGWDNGLGVGQSFTVSPTTQTTYAAGVMDDNGCAASDIVVVNVLPPLSVTTSMDDSICPGDSINISALAVAGSGNGGPYNYTWNDGAGVSLGAGKDQQVFPSTTTTYYVTLNDGCSTSAIDSVTIYIHPLPDVNFVADTLSLCQIPQLPFEFTNLTANTDSAFWSFSFSDTDTGMVVTHLYEDIGSYDITLTVISTLAEGGCTNSLTKTNYVEVVENPTAEFTMDPNPTSSINTTVSFYDQSFDNIVEWNWDFGGLDSNFAQNPVYFFPEDSGNYWIKLMVTDINGCKNLDSNLLVVIGEYGVFVPNTFTPDFDGLNDDFFPKGFGISEGNYSFSIYDRWGTLIFKSHQLFEAWDGTYNELPCQHGVYVWKLEFIDIIGISRKEVGKVSVLR